MKVKPTDDGEMGKRAIHLRVLYPGACGSAASLFADNEIVDGALGGRVLASLERLLVTGEWLPPGGLEADMSSPPATSSTVFERAQYAVVTRRGRSLAVVIDDGHLVASAEGDEPDLAVEMFGRAVREA